MYSMMIAIFIHKRYDQSSIDVKEMSLAQRARLGIDRSLL